MDVLAVISALSPGVFRRFAGRTAVEHALDAVRSARPVTHVVLLVRDAAAAGDVAADSGVDVIVAPSAVAEYGRAAELAFTLEYLGQHNRLGSAVAVLVDPLFPWCDAELIGGAIDHLVRCGADTLLSVSRIDGAMWLQDESGFAKPFDRGPAERRYVENGALLAVRAGVFEQSRELPVGRTVLYEIPALAALKLTPEADWFAADTLIRRQQAARARSRLRDVRMLVLDFDGVMTDNRVLVFADGTEAVLCNRSDGLGLERLKASGLPLAVISKEKHPVVAARCRKLSIPCHQGIDDKLATLRQVAEQEHGLPLAAVAFMGNDINDLQCLRAAGVAIATADAYPEVLRAADIITRAPGGFGAVREVCDLMLDARSPD
jgi:YrbI family 3-deoxy-D-manno-octulosonate 8-phosphate phosphatase